MGSVKQETHWWSGKMESERTDPRSSPLDSTKAGVADGPQVACGPHPPAFTPSYTLSQGGRLPKEEATRKDAFLRRCTEPVARGPGLGFKQTLRTVRGIPVT